MNDPAARCGVIFYKLVSIQKRGFLFEIKPPARGAYAPEGPAKNFTTGI